MFSLEFSVGEGYCHFWLGFYILFLVVFSVLYWARDQTWVSHQLKVLWIKFLAPKVTIISLWMEAIGGVEQHCTMIRIYICSVVRGNFWYWWLWDDMKYWELNLGLIEQVILTCCTIFLSKLILCSMQCELLITQFDLVKLKV